ncbi:MAG: PTS galactitol transporter subunit IIC [Propionibacteriaceae bacterium]|nr:PTS galactitol transporter subunit IIC [Propionibacteriaceae bacterium]
MDIIQQILNAGAVVMLPIVMFLLGLILRMKIGKAFKAGLMVGIGFAGINLVINLLMTTVQPAIDYYKSLGTTGYTTVDIGWAAMGASSFSVPFAAPAILLVFGLNVVLVLLGWTKVLNVDIWNFIHFLIPATLAYALTGNLWVGLGTAVFLGIITLFFAQWIAPKWESFYGLEGTTCSTFSFITYAYPLGWLINWLFDRIPKVRDIDVSLEKISDKLGVVGDPAFIGLVVGIFLGCITLQPWTTVLTMGMGTAAVLVLLPKMVSVMMEGLAAIGEGAKAFMKRHTKDDRELYIGMDIALALGDPTAITVTVFMIPLAVLYAFLIPGMTYFPLGLLTVIVYMVPMISLATKGNVFRTLIGSAIYLFFVEFCANLFAPEATMMMNATGVSVTGQITDGSFGFNPAAAIISAIHHFFFAGVAA